MLVDGDQLAGLDLADHAGADGGQGRVLGGDDPAAVESPEHERPHALGVARGVQGVLVHPDEREGSLEQRQHLQGSLLERRVRVVRQQRGDQAGVVGRRLELAGVDVELVVGVGQLVDQAGEVVGVDQVAVVAEGDGPVGGRAEGRLRVLPGARTGRGVARVADREVALEGVEGRLVEHLRDETHVLVDEDLPTVADRDAGRLLAAVLEGVETEVGQLGDVLARRPDAEDPTHVAESREYDGADPHPRRTPVALSRRMHLASAFGEGSTFHVVLPLARPVRALLSPRSRARRTSTPQRSDPP